MTKSVDPLPTTLENELLRCCTRVAVDEDTQARITVLVSQPLDWDVVAKRSWWHRIRPLTYRYLKSHASGHVPSDVLLALARDAAELAIRNQRLSKALEDVARIFEEAGLRALTFKGPALAKDAYGDLELRECGDLDLIVHPDDFPQVEAMLREHGFKSQWDNEQANRQVFACEFEREDAALDVHWHLAPGWLNYRVDFDWLWSHGSPLVAGGELFRKLAPEDSLVVLSIHGSKHWWERLRWIGDVAEIVDRGLIQDWERVDESSQLANASRSVYLGLWLAQEVLSVEMPLHVETRLEQVPVLPRLGAQVHEWLEQADSGQDQRRLRDRFWFRMGVCERMRDRVPQFVHYLLSRP